ncbi:MAG TPA: phosphopantetheine-binding protein [Thermohalobaculum sp.]|nr:phosphopantetheine-binding protein [Thermohalobaculum sp.]
MPDDILVIVTAELQKLTPRQVTPQTEIMRDLGLDSLAVMNFVMTLEERFDLSIPMDRIAEVETVADLSDTIHALRTGAAA